MKRTVYLVSSTILGIILSTIVHAAIEIGYIVLLVKDFDRWSLGFSWKNWEIIHTIGSVVLFALGAYCGYHLGVRWWQVVYIEKRHWFMQKK